MGKSALTAFMTVLAFFAVTSCNQGTILKERHKFENNTWKRINDDIRYEVEITDVKKQYDLTIPIRHASFYPYQYLEIAFNIYSPSGQESYSVKKIYLKDPEGNWKGKGMGDIWDFDYKLFEDYTFNEPGKYTFEMQNLTGNNLFLPGIMEIGLIISRTKK
ncbi:MAG: gliding motility lipoprotein GldH [Bacteroidales bacterium]